MTGIFPAKQKSLRIEHANKCEAIDLSDGKECRDRAFNALYQGHDGVGRPYIVYLCDRHEMQRPNR